MKVLPSLNLNKHPQEVEMGGLTDAHNAIVSNDNIILQSEPLLVNSSLDELLKEAIDVEFEVLYMIQCNTELVLFIDKGDDGKLSLYRFNEKLAAVKYCTDIEYSGGEFCSTFTYNNNELIVAFSEYDLNDGLDVPLRSINLGSFEDGVSDNDLSQLTDTDLHSLCPKVRIPYVSYEYIDGTAYKGWYYIFVRYKISENTYTQWFDTNQKFLVNSCLNKCFFNYVYSVNNSASYKNYYMDLSDDSDISNISFKLAIDNMDSRYMYYQLGFACISKSYSKGYISADINVGNNAFTFSSKNVSDYDVSSLITTFQNYYNVKTLCNSGNSLYIANYKEKYDYNCYLELLNSLNISLDFYESEVEYNGSYGDIVILNNVKYNGKKLLMTAVGGDIDNPETIYFTAAYFPYEFIVSGDVRLFGFINLAEYTGNVLVSYFDKDNVKQNIDGMLPSDIKFYPYRTNSAGNSGTITFTIDGVESELIGSSGYEYGKTTITVSSGGNTYYDYNIGFGASDQTLKFTTPYIDNTALGDSYYTLASASIFPNELYNFFIHFVDDYGNVSKGINISEFKNISTNGKQYINDIGNTLILTPDIVCDKVLKLKCTVYGYEYVKFRYFISYEEPQRRRVYSGVMMPEFEKGSSYKKTDYSIFFSTELNVNDSLNLKFTNCRVLDTKRTLSKNDTLTEFIQESTDYVELDVSEKEILVADSIDNLLQNTCLRMALKKDGVVYNISDPCVVELYADTAYNEYYTSLSKTLIPCSKIVQQSKGSLSIDIDTKDCMISEHTVFRYYSDRLTNNANNEWAGVYFDASELNFKFELSSTDSSIPFYVYKYNRFVEVPDEFLQFNNKPAIYCFPTHIESGNNKYKYGYIVEAKNCIDLLQQKNCSVYALYPKSLDNYNDDITYENLFPKTIRRSNPIQDESHENSWRKFDLDTYKAINENKGDIVKLISIGYYFMIHTQHSIFLLNGSDTIKSEESNIQLSDVDIFNISYKELVTSELGYAGLQNQNHGLVGTFGYVFYDSDDRRIFRYDNKSLKPIDTDITNYIKRLDGYDLYLCNDVRRNRILFKFFKNDSDVIVLSYNYNIGTFVSFHDVNYFRGFSTKENLYIVNSLKNYIFEYGNTAYRELIVDIMLNRDYETMKYIESVIYKLNKVKELNGLRENYPLERMEDYYAGDFIQVFSEYCDTGLLPINLINTEEYSNINDFMNYTMPAWRLGNWHFNFLRNKSGNPTADESSRIYGNWFVVRIRCNQSDKQCEIKTIEPMLTNAEII